MPKPKPPPDPAKTMPKKVRVILRQQTFCHGDLETRLQFTALVPRAIGKRLKKIAGHKHAVPEHRFFYQHATSLN
jgi:hypothetical protein